MICWSRRGEITGSPARFDPPCESVLARTSAAREALRQSRRLSCGRRLCCYLIDQGSGKQRAAEESLYLTQIKVPTG
jgi:hypothetical protein